MLLVVVMVVMMVYVISGDGNIFGSIYGGGGIDDVGSDDVDRSDTSDGYTLSISHGANDTGW